MSKIQVKSLNKSFKNNGKTAVVLEDINISVKENEFISLLGPSGCGKSIYLQSWPVSKSRFGCCGDRR